MRPYEHLDIIPELVAETVAGEVYTGNYAERVEPLRAVMTFDQREEFIRETDTRCRAAYDGKADWFLKIVRSRSNAGRDRLYMFARMWLGAFLLRDIAK